MLWEDNVLGRIFWNQVKFLFYIQNINFPTEFPYSSAWLSGSQWTLSGTVSVFFNEELLVLSDPCPKNQNFCPTFFSTLLQYVFCQPVQQRHPPTTMCVFICGLLQALWLGWDCRDSHRWRCSLTALSRSMEAHQQFILQDKDLNVR